MAMTLPLDDQEIEALRRAAEGRSMQEVAREAIRLYVTNRQDQVRSMFERMADEDAELLDRLGR